MALQILKTTHLNSFFKFHNDVVTRPECYSQWIIKQVKLQKEMLEKFDFIEEYGKKCIDWIETFCILTEGENAGKKVKLLMWQKWFIYSIFSFWGNVETEEFDEEGKLIGMTTKYIRIVNEVLLMIASGNAKTTLLGFINAYLLFSNTLPSCKIYIGSNAYRQSRLCFDTTMNILKKHDLLRKNTSFRNSIGEIEVSRTNAKITAMSSDGKNFEGIIPAVLIIDEIHEMKTSKYADDLKKSTKRSDKLIIEATTDGTVRGGYLDQRKELAHAILNNESEVKDYRKLFAIFAQDNEQEIFDAYYNNDVSVYLKSNPSLGAAVSVELLKEKVADMLNDPKQRVTILTKNFNLPQNPITSYFSESECKALPFDESIFYGAPVFLGLDMAYTRTPESDLACLEIMVVNPFTHEEYCKDFYFLPKYYHKTIKDNGFIDIRKEDMAILKSKEDSNILYNKKQNKYGYKMYAERGDVIIIDEELVNMLVSEFGQSAHCDCTGVTEDFIIYFIAHLELKYKWTICKFGLDPNKASKIESVCNRAIRSIDGKPPLVKFRMEEKRVSNPIIQATKDIRSQGLVHNNNKLTELHFAAAQAKEDQYGNIIFTNAQRERKDGVIANLACRSAYNVFTTNKDSGEANLNLLKEWWNGRMEKGISHDTMEEA